MGNNSPELERLFLDGSRRSAPREFALMLSRRCNIACRHCGIESSPLVRDRMSLKDAKRFIVEAAALPEFRKVTFTGGEPTLVRRDLLALLALCRELGLQTRIVTNGWWARNRSNGYRYLKALRDAGLTELNFSADKFHLEFTDAATLRNALQCARDLDFAQIVSFVCTGETEPMLEFAQMYEVDPHELADLRDAFSENAKLVDLRRDRIHVYWGGLIGLGWAASYPSELRYHPLDFFPVGNQCGEVVNKPVIYPDGTFQACCCAGGKVAAFTVGNAHDSSVAELFDLMKARSHFRLINTHGPRQLYDIMRSALPSRRVRDDFTSICELCVEATRGVPADVVDNAVDSWLLAETLKALTTQG